MTGSIPTPSSATAVPIESEEEYEALLSEIDQILRLPEEARDFKRLDEVSDRVYAYEEIHYPMPIKPVDPIDIIEFFLEDRGLTRSDLESLIGNKERVEAVMNRHRPLTLPMIRRIHEQLNIRLELLVPPYRLVKGARSNRTSTRVPPSNGRDQETSAPIKSAR